jgi:uncharacterized protein GlcG (DUF336 family)
MAQIGASAAECTWVWAALDVHLTAETAMPLNLTTARTLIDAALAEGASRKLKPLAVAVLDARGCMIAFAAQEGTSLLREQIARGKASGALALGLGSRALFKRAQEQPYFIDAVNSLAGGALIPVPGGVLVRDAGGALLGAVGISGDTSDNDEACCLAGIAAAALVAETG